MSDMCMGRCWRKGVLIRTLMLWTFIGLCCAGHRPFSRQERPPHSRHHDRATQRLQYPSLHELGAQRVEFPSVNDQGAQMVLYPSLQNEGQKIQYPSVSDNSQVQKCAPGFYREGDRPYLGRCVPCECNGLTNECEDWTGRCLNCQYNTAGDRCERCKEGYYGNAAQRTCILCPCPFSTSANSFAVGCRNLLGITQCFCKTGYTGDRCESCAPGYYGDPLTPGGSCQPCNCNGNSNNCDPKTGVCKNTLEPGDTNTDEQCQECDNCALTLLRDLEKLDDELEAIKNQLDNVSASATFKDRLEKLEKALSDTKTLVNTFSSTISNKIIKVDQLKKDMANLADKIDSLQDKADERAAEADKAVANVEKTHKRAMNLESEIENILKKIIDLLEQLRNQDGRGDAFPNESLTNMLNEAQRMVTEMQNRNFTSQKTAAETERDEAKKLLDYVKNNMSDLCDQNEAAADKIRTLLKDYGGKLEELEEALKEARDLVKQANVQNGLNAKTLENLQKRMNVLETERKTVEDQMAMAEDELQKTEDLVKMLSDSKTDYEQLAAQLDGAKNDLTEKVKDITEAAAKTDIVEAAEEHAKNLTKLAKELEDAVKNASGRSEVRDAKDAIQAYKNILDAINAAEAAANEARDAADAALNTVKKQNLTKKAKELKENGDDLLKSAEEAQKDLQDTTGDLTDLKKRLSEAENKKTALEKSLLDAQNQLNDVNADDIENMIEEAKRKAASANNSATNTMDKLNSIKTELDKINISPVDTNLNNVLKDVDQSVKNLWKTIPTLNDKISAVENLNSQFSPINNISESIRTLKELIAHARDAANKIAVPMKFNGNSHVELHPPKNLDDLRAYTAMSLLLQRPKGRGDGARRRRQLPPGQFVLYLGNRDSSKNYIGLVLRNDVLYGVYKLNGVEYEIKSDYISRSDSEPAMFDKVDLRRIYQDAEIVLTKEVSSRNPKDPLMNFVQGQEGKDLLDVSPSDIVFYVGGYPANFTPPSSMNYSKYKGCIEFSSFNDKVLSLYNFKTEENVNLETICKRYLPPVDSDLYDGTGFGKVLMDEIKRTYVKISMSVLTRLPDGMLAFIGGGDNYVILTVEGGTLVVRGNKFAESPVILPVSKRIFPTNDWTDIQLILTTVGLVRISVGSLSEKGNKPAYDFKIFNELYVGGIPQELRDRFNLTIRPYKGCLKNFKFQDLSTLIDEPLGISRGCPTDSLIARQAQFSWDSSLSADLAGFTLDNDITVSLGFKSTQNQSLILQDKSPTNEIILALENGYVILQLGGKRWKSEKQYHDGQWHYLTATRRAGRTVLRVDNADYGKEQSGAGTFTETGGQVVLGNRKFKGCISNFYTRREENRNKAEDFSTFEVFGDVQLDVYTPFSPAQLMLDRASRKVDVIQVTNESISSCELPAQTQHAYRVGGPFSSLSYSLPLQVLQPRPHFSLDVRTRSPEGLLFFAATRGGQSHLALYMSKGRIRLSVAKQKEIFNREKYNDGKWHSIIFSLEKKKFRLVVDGLKAQDGQLTSAELKSMQQFMSPVYLGGVPASFHKELKLKTLPKQGVSGCIRKFKMNGAQMSNPTANFGAGPCFEGQTQRGAYFSGDGAHVVINDSFVVSSTLELLFNIRPHAQSGLLLHVGDSSRTPSGFVMSHFLTVYMLRGEMVVRVNQGGGEFMVSVKPKASLCDENFHKISVIKRKNVVQLSVDTMDNYKIGPPSSTSTLTKDPLYVGGIPGTLMHQTLPVRSSFVGCIQDMKINDMSVSFDRSSAVFGPVNLKECPG